jgi:hypothetical protein
MIGIVQPQADNLPRTLERCPQAHPGCIGCDCEPALQCAFPIARERFPREGDRFPRATEPITSEQEHHVRWALRQCPPGRIHHALLAQELRVCLWDIQNPAILQNPDARSAPLAVGDQPHTASIPSPSSDRLTTRCAAAHAARCH